MSSRPGTASSLEWWPKRSREWRLQRDRSVTKNVSLLSFNKSPLTSTLRLAFVTPGERNAVGNRYVVSACDRRPSEVATGVTVWPLGTVRLTANSLLRILTTIVNDGHGGGSLSVIDRRCRNNHRVSGIGQRHGEEFSGLVDDISRTCTVTGGSGPVEARPVRRWTEISPCQRGARKGRNPLNPFGARVFEEDRHRGVGGLSFGFPQRGVGEVPGAGWMSSAVGMSCFR